MSTDSVADIPVNVAASNHQPPPPPSEPSPTESVSPTEAAWPAGFASPAKAARAEIDVIFARGLKELFAEFEDPLPADAKAAVEGAAEHEVVEDEVVDDEVMEWDPGSVAASSAPVQMETGSGAASGAPSMSDTVEEAATPRPAPPPEETIHIPKISGIRVDVKEASQIAPWHAPQAYNVWPMPCVPPKAVQSTAPSPKAMPKHPGIAVFGGPPFPVPKPPPPPLEGPVEVRPAPPPYPPPATKAKAAGSVALAAAPPPRQLTPHDLFEAWCTQWVPRLVGKNRHNFKILCQASGLYPWLDITGIGKAGVSNGGVSADALPIGGKGVVYYRCTFAEDRGFQRATHYDPDPACYDLVGGHGTTDPDAVGILRDRRFRRFKYEGIYGLMTIHCEFEWLKSTMCKVAGHTKNWSGVLMEIRAHCRFESAGYGGIEADAVLVRRGVASHQSKSNGGRWMLPEPFLEFVGIWLPLEGPLCDSLPGARRAF